jgi:hypothetical protein
MQVPRIPSREGIRPLVNDFVVASGVIGLSFSDNIALCELVKSLANGN